MKISWYTRSKLLNQSINGRKLMKGSNGGNIYDFNAAMVLSDQNELKAEDQSVWNDDNLFSYWKKVRQLDNCDIAVYEPYPIVFGKLNERAINIAIIHHIDLDSISNSLKHRWFFWRLLKRLRKMDTVVTVSNYWKEYLENKGCHQVKVIYNSFDSSLYRFDQEQIIACKKKYGFDLERPIVYIGNASAQKGTQEVFEAIGGMDVQMVMTGRVNELEHIPVKYLDLAEEDYRLLIASCDVVCAFSKMMEGWNRIAHEAMLCQVPVIGSGSGGMKELLIGGGQLITTDKKELVSLLSKAISEKEVLGTKGYEFAKRFDLEYFANSWKSLS